MSDLLNFSIALAIEAGELLSSLYNLGGMPASQKPDQTAVTMADLAADRLITEKIQQHFPSDGIITEESAHMVPKIDSPVWVIDPLDGTTNFSLGLPIWGVSIARLSHGYPDLGVLYFPCIHELYTVEAGSGAFLNQQPITVRAPDPTQPMSFFACCSRSFRTFDISIPYKPRIFGSGAYSLCMLARGSALLALDSAPKLWDLAAAWPLIHAAGGIIETLDGQSIFPLAPGQDYATTDWPVLAAATPKLMEFGRQKIRRKTS